MPTSHCSILTGIQIYHGKQCCHKVWMDSNENCGRNSTFKIPNAYCPVLRKISKCHKWQIAKKSDDLYDYDTLYKVWMNGMKIVTGAEL